ncbi:hypothetical protein [Kutzneria albida]|uniref:Uncharacterized protein n=1 Tax=Kutzneria albida DSM 43870 TaxID=1449976 RepID=W5W081_9PSEU|nr:hypothetical protein [Kutzneria albida]AHH94227.1 hypothetical protein KALB_853 [Kutzneria albida DSM 43870]
MAERNSWAVSDAPNGVITTEDARLALSALAQPGADPVSARQGLRAAPGDPGRVSAAAKPDATVTVQPFQMFMQSKRGLGNYVQTLDRAKTLDLITDHPADSKNPRIDLIIAQQTDKFYGDTVNGFLVTQVVGTASGTPNPPTVPGPGDYLELARVRIPASAKEITADMIEDRRQGSVVGLGGVVPLRGVAERAQLTAYPGLTTYRADRGWLEVSDGTAWRVPGVPVCASPNELSTISSPYQGQLVASIQDGLLYQWDGAKWVGVAGGVGGMRHEARYEVRAGQEQNFPQNLDTRIKFPTATYTSPDVSPSSDNSVFTLNRAGLWSISVSLRINAPGGDGFYEVYVAITDGANLGMRYANQHDDRRAVVPGSISCATEYRFTAGDTVSVILWTSAAQNRNTQAWTSLNNITLTWLRS